MKKIFNAFGSEVEKIQKKMKEKWELINNTNKNLASKKFAYLTNKSSIKNEVFIKRAR